MMKAVHFTIDPALLRRIDAHPETRRDGRSALVRRAVREYLARSRAQEIRDAYRTGYGAAPAGDEELGPWLVGKW